MQPRHVRQSTRHRPVLVVAFLAILVMTFILVSVLDRRAATDHPTPKRLSPTQLYEVLDPYIDKLCDAVLRLRNLLY